VHRCVYIVGHHCVLVQVDIRELQEDGLYTGDAKWKDSALKVRSALGIHPDARPFTRNHQTLSGIPKSCRVLESLDIAWGARHALQRTLPFFCDLNPSIDRGNTFGPTLPCISQKSRIFDFSTKSVVTAPQMLLLLGLPAWDLELPNVSSTRLFSFVGEMMYAPSVGAIMLAHFLNPLAPWWSQSLST
jgi:hypothetical protein